LRTFARAPSPEGIQNLEPRLRTSYITLDLLRKNPQFSAVLLVAGTPTCRLFAWALAGACNAVSLARGPALRTPSSDSAANPSRARSRRLDTPPEQLASGLAGANGPPLHRLSTDRLRAPRLRSARSGRVRCRASADGQHPSDARGRARGCSCMRDTAYLRGSCSWTTHGLVFSERLVPRQLLDVASGAMGF